VFRFVLTVASSRRVQIIPFSVPVLELLDPRKVNVCVMNGLGGRALGTHEICTEARVYCNTSFRIGITGSEWF